MANPTHLSNGAANPEFLRVVIAEEKPASERTVAEQAVLALNSSMMTLYDQTLESKTKPARTRTSIILALFSGSNGGHYRPTASPICPVVTNNPESVGHSSMAVYQIVEARTCRIQPTNRGAVPCTFIGPRTSRPSPLCLPWTWPTTTERCSAPFSNTTWRSWTNVSTGGRLRMKALRSTSAAAHHSVNTIGIAAPVQVGHWMKVVEGWKKLLGKEWESVYALSNTLYVARQNNILFTVLAQFMGMEAIGDRLILIETAEFTTTPEKMLDVLTRIVSDRGIGLVFFKDYFLMDVELLGGGGRAAIEREMTKRGLQPLLPSRRVPFRLALEDRPTKGRALRTEESKSQRANTLQRRWIFIVLRMIRIFIWTRLQDRCAALAPGDQLGDDADSDLGDGLRADVEERSRFIWIGSLICRRKVRISQMQSMKADSAVSSPSSFLGGVAPHRPRRNPSWRNPCCPM